MPILPRNFTSIATDSHTKKISCGIRKENLLNYNLVGTLCGGAALGTRCGGAALGTRCGGAAPSTQIMVLNACSCSCTCRTSTLQSLFQYYHGMDNSRELIAGNRKKKKISNQQCELKFYKWFQESKSFLKIWLLCVN